MSSEDDEILQSFIDESREHLADIENDLLAIEEAGADIDEDLVNKAFGRPIVSRVGPVSWDWIRSRTFRTRSKMSWA
jgi:hypothetical protein